MPDIPGFWKGGPHDPVAVEPLWREFVLSVGGLIVEETLPQPRAFDNADFAFLDASVVAELKEIETEFSSSRSFLIGFDELLRDLVAREPRWRPLLFGGDGTYPPWFVTRAIRLFRPPLARILKKANKQLRETKQHFGISSQAGIVLLVNDGFTSIGPRIIRGLVSDLLLHSYSSIDCFIYLTVNRYVEEAGSDEPKLLWVPTYSARAPDQLVDFIDSLGRSWFDFLETKIGPFTSRAEIPQHDDVLFGARAIILPSENGG